MKGDVDPKTIARNNRTENAKVSDGTSEGESRGKFRVEFRKVTRGNRDVNTLEARGRRVKKRKRGKISGRGVGTGDARKTRGECAGTRGMGEAETRTLRRVEFRVGGEREGATSGRELDGRERKTS